jgi:exosortase/archaeosortase family protein
MASFMKHPLGLVALQAAAFVPVWQWYVRRLFDGSDEPWGLLALGTALALFYAQRGQGGSEHLRLEVPGTVILLYAVTYPFVPHLVQAGLATTALGLTLSEIRFGTWVHAPTLGLMLLSLPVIPSLQFYFGYPLRVISASLAAPLLQFSGMAVVREGTCLRWGNDLVSVDAPCSGVQMAWVGMYCVCTVAGLLGLSTPRTFALVCLALPLILAGNAVRSASLFYLETGIIPLPGWAHDAAGLVTFAGVVSCLLILARSFRTRGERVCEG